MIITFDLDGVIADRTHLPPDMRSDEYFINKQLLEPIVPGCIARLARKHAIYVVTSREYARYPVTQAWLAKVGINQSLSGILCVNSYSDKAFTINHLTDLHFDDDVRVLDELCTPLIYLVDNPEWPANQTDSEYPRVMCWQDIMKVCADL